MTDLFLKIKERLKQADKKRIIFPEFTDERILSAANRLAQENLLVPVFIGSENEV